MNPVNKNNDVDDSRDMALLGHEAEIHFHSLEPTVLVNPPKDVALE